MEAAKTAVDAQTHAQKLFAAQGLTALAEVTQKVREFEKNGGKQSARDWKQIANALQQMRGLNAS